jgi:CBS domain-containing protein
MKLHSLFKEDHVLVHGEGETLADVVHHLMGTFKTDIGEGSVRTLTELVLQRERNNPTLQIDGFCFPHIRNELISEFHLGMAVPETPVSHPRKADARLRIVFLALAPQNQNTLLLQTLATLRRLASTKSFAHTAEGVRTSTRLIRIIEESGLDVKRGLTARDIMEDVQYSLKLDTSMLEAVDLLSKARDEGLPVVDSRGHLTGELTTREVLLVGMPKYMELLSNLEMLNAFEPFENYFVNEHKLSVRDVCRRDYTWVEPTTPIVRVAHLMMTQNRRRIYVLEDERIVGIIYRKSILTRVMNY